MLFYVGMRRTGEKISPMPPPRHLQNLVYRGRKRGQLFFWFYVFLRRTQYAICYQIDQPPPPQGSEHSGSLGGPMNPLLLWYWSSLNKLAGDVGL